MRAWILTIGNELLIGRIVNTNASWLAKKLVFLGFDVRRIIVVPDDKKDISEELKRALERADLVVTTGGLGPTYDDMTSDAVAYTLNKKLVLDERALSMVEQFYKAKNMELTPERIKMAYVPEGARVIENPVGAAPAYMVEVDGKTIIVLPGVPAEMKAIFEKHVEEYLRKKYAPHTFIVEYNVIVKGVPESGLAPFINELSKKHRDVYIKSHPKGHETSNPVLDIRVFVSSNKSRDEAEEKAKKIIDEIIEEARKLGGTIVESGRTL
ncbi:MAG: nicotinamide mononucleotide deamidase-related protein [Desulfurococcales archaeon]|nr:nicotinamide mononucleotide deamidase-related protein [Desulfurococcales archaeon]MEB3846149.1 nicotinamide mononucleotide deamidase-related protein [Desulfurococcales archaeon]